jgi:rod shape-determining protein MreC
VALGADRSGTRADTATFLVCLLLSLTALALPEGVRAPLAGGLRRTVLLPFLTVENRTVRSAAYRRSMDVLRAQRDSLALRSALLPQLEAENLHLRGMLGLARRLGAGFVPADVLHQAGVSDGLTLVLSAGRASGVRPLEPVVAPEGLVGLVRTVDRHTSVALAWTHPDFRVGAMVDGSHVYGIVTARRGEREGEVMELRGIAYRDTLRAGTLVVTSGLGGVFPRGIPVGTVEGVLSESEGWERTYLLKPAVHPASASHVMILSLERSPDTLATVFTDTLAADSTPVRAAAPARRLPPRAFPPAGPR